MNSALPLGITMGDASGVGPEIVLRAFLQNETPERFVVYGEHSAMAVAVEMLDLRDKVSIHLIDTPEEALSGQLNLIDNGMLSREQVTPGKLSATAGTAARECVRKATLAALDQTISAIVTLPINKEATRLTTPTFSGHTEFIAELCGNPECTMMLASSRLMATHVSTHVSLSEAIQRTKAPRILKVIQLTHDAAGRIRPQPRIAVAGLNPHAGEHGAFGSEDADEIAPAIEQARARGIDAQGPFPPDTVFLKAFNADFDAVVCMYHDQGHIPMKLMGFHDSVNITIGLPIVRTSVDHGTAFDIAYQGKASTQSFATACRYAALLADQ